MDYQKIREVVYHVSVISLGSGLVLLSLLFFHFETPGHQADLLKLVIPLCLSLGVITLGVGLVRGETGGHHVFTVWLSGVGGILLMGVVSAWMFAIQQLEGASVAQSQYLVLSNVSIGAAVGTVFGVYRVRLQQRTDQLEREVNRLNEFAGIVAHDLRNPLHIAQGYVAELPRNGVKDHLARIEQAHARMERLIDHVLALSRRGATVGDMTAIDIRPVAETAWTDMPTGTADLQVTTDCLVEADERRLRSLFENLFRNAIDHGGDDVTITVGALENGFYIADDGVGISPDHREQIFEGGYSGDDTGTGMGLAIVRQIAEAHEWTIAVTDSTTGGARFEFIER